MKGSPRGSVSKVANELGRLPASAECQNGARYFGSEVCKARSGKILLHRRKVEYVKAVISAVPVTHRAKLQDATATCDEREDGKNCSRLHDASHLAQGSYSIRKEMTPKPPPLG
jgi:hypothetical protein